MEAAFPVERLLRPRSIAVVGVSSDPGSLGGRALANLDRFGFSGDVHLVSRTSALVDERATIPTIDDLPDGVDALILALPAPAVRGAAEAAARRSVGGMVVFASGFSETGDDGRREQEQVAAVCREAGIAMLGPNTLGLTNYVDGVPLGFGPNQPDLPAGRPTLAAIAQSGAMAASMRLSSLGRGLAVSYSVATGNEAVTGVEDFLAAVVEDPSTHAVAIYAEQLRKPRLFLRLAARARALGKPVVLLHPGRSRKAREAAASHTGALAGDWAVMRAMVESEAVVLVETLEELLDASELLTRYPDPPRAGPSVMTDSGAFKGLALDLAEAIGLDLPPITATTSAKLAERLPAFASHGNPLDITAQGLKDMPLYGGAADILRADADSGGLMAALMPGSPEVGLLKAQAVLPALTAPGKPVCYVVMGGAAPVSPGLEQTVLDAGVPFFRSPERALRAFGHVGRYALRKAAAAGEERRTAPVATRLTGQGVLPEHVSKRILADAGLRVPEGKLATSFDQAHAAAERIGWPVVLKAQSADLPHKSDAGGVRIGIADAEALRTAWAAIEADVARARPDLTLDGLLVERMGAPGVELVVGGRNDPSWGPLLVFGLGGVWIEALDDVRLVRADASEALIAGELARLRGRVLLDGYRGSPPVDIDAVIAAFLKVGRLLCAHPEIGERDVNPLVVFPTGAEPIALDALITLRPI